MDAAVKQSENFVYKILGRNPKIQGRIFGSTFSATHKEKSEEKLSIVTTALDNGTYKNGVKVTGSTAHTKKGFRIMRNPGNAKRHWLRVILDPESRKPPCFPGCFFFDAAGENCLCVLSPLESEKSHSSTYSCLPEILQSNLDFSCFKFLLKCKHLVQRKRAAVSNHFWR